MAALDILRRPPANEGVSGPEMWVDELIWGHRLHDEQAPWLIFLEFLGVLRAEHAAHRALKEEGGLNTLSYRPQSQLRLRNLIFNNPYLASLELENLPDEVAWKRWLELMNENAGGLPVAAFGYVRDKFDSFEDFCAVVKFLQSSAIEGSSNKRWSSKFVFPFGPHALYEDLLISKNGSSNDRRFFARTGELLYLMLCRSSHVDELRDLILAKLFSHETPYDGLVAALQGEDQFATNERGGSYLPCATHPIFDQIAKDWISILDSPISAFDALPHLVNMTGLNLIRYQLDRARQIIDAAPITMVCEIVSSKRSSVRDISADSYQQNNLLPSAVLEPFILDIKTTQQWQSAIVADDAVQSAAEVLERQFAWPGEDALDSQFTMPDDLLRVLIEKTSKRHEQHVARVHATWTRQIGLSSRRSSRRTRYAPTDRLLKTLVVCCVPTRMEFKDFLDELFTRYGLIIGETHASGYVANGAADQKDFSENARRLEERLLSLGLLNRLSDSAAYVQNPLLSEARA